MKPSQGPANEPGMVAGLEDVVDAELDYHLLMQVNATLNVRLRYTMYPRSRSFHWHASQKEGSLLCRPVAGCASLMAQ